MYVCVFRRLCERVYIFTYYKLILKLLDFYKAFHMESYGMLSIVHNVNECVN